MWVLIDWFDQGLVQVAVTGRLFWGGKKKSKNVEGRELLIFVTSYHYCIRLKESKIPAGIHVVISCDYLNMCASCHVALKLCFHVDRPALHSSCTAPNNVILTFLKK